VTGCTRCLCGFAWSAETKSRAHTRHAPSPSGPVTPPRRLQHHGSRSSPPRPGTRTHPTRPLARSHTHTCMYILSSSVTASSRPAPTPAPGLSDAPPRLSFRSVCARAA
jgi:hypothetical protein